MMLKSVMTGLVSLVCLLACSSVGDAAPENTSRTIIRGAEIFDATGKPAYKADVEIIGNRFTSIQPAIKPQRGDRVVDAKGLSLLPGLVDVHVHWTSMGGVSRADVATLLLTHGVTTATDFHSMPESFAPKREWQQTLIAPHTVFSARTATYGGHGADWGDRNMTRLAVSSREGNSIIRDVVRYKPDAIKVFADGWRYGSGINNASMNVDALAAIVSAASDYSLPVVTHTVTVEGARVAAEAGVTAIVHAIQDRRIHDDLVALMQSQGIYYAPTLAVYEPNSSEAASNNTAQHQLVEYRQEISRFNLQKLLHAGVPIALGTDTGIAGTAFGEASVHELELLVSFGLTPQQALIAGTVNSSAVLGLDEDRGTIEAGKRADFVLVRGKPWENVSDYRNLVSVFLDGKEVVKNGALVTPQGHSIPPSRIAESLIDDFERGDGLTAGEASRLVDVEYGFPRSHLIMQRIIRETGEHALQLAAHMADKDNARAYVVLPLTPGSVVPSDVSHFSGLEFEARGDGGEFQIELVSHAGTATYSFVANTDWESIKVPFDQFTVDSVSLETVYAVKIGSQRPGGETYWVEIDDVNFY